MTQHRSTLIFLVFAAWLAPGSVTATPATTDAPAGTATPSGSDDENTRAHAMYRHALELFRAQHHQESRKVLLQLWEIRKTYDVASALAKTEMKLGLYRDAANHLQFCLDNFAPVSGKKVLDTIKQMMAESKAHVGTLRVKTNRDGAEVRVDGHAVGVSPLKSPIHVDPGQHEVMVSGGGDKTTEPVEIAAGSELEVDVPLERPVHPAHDPGAAVPLVTVQRVTAPMAPVAPPPAPPPSATRAPRSIVPVIVGGAVFVAGLGTGIGFLLAANSKRDEATALMDQNGRYGCYGIGSTSCTDQKNAWQAQDLDRNLSTAGFVVAGAALLAVPIYWYWPRHRGSDTSSSAIRVRGSVDAQSRGLLIAGEF